MSKLARLFSTIILAALLVLPVVSSSPVMAGDPYPPKTPVVSPHGEEAEELHDSDHNKVLDDLDKRLVKAKDTDTFPVVLIFKKPLSEINFQALRGKLGSFAIQYEYPNINGVSLTLDSRQIKAFAPLTDVQQLEYDAAMKASLDTAVPWFGVAKARTDFGVTGNADGQSTYSKNDIVIAIIDTGIDAGHVDLDSGKVIGWQDIVGGRTTPYDDNGHGTHVASITAGEGQANPTYTGVAPGAALVGIKVLNAAGSGSLSQVLAGVQWAIDNKANFNIKVINMSLGLAGNSDGTDALSQMVNSAVAAGIVTVVAAGNEGPAAHTIGSPGAAASAITIGSMADPGEGGFFLSYYSSRGPTADGRIKPDVASPGQAITAARAGSGTGYTTMSGTSMATPFVAGVAALMENANAALSPANVKSIITSTAADWGPVGADPDYGAGRLDAYAAIKSAAQATTGISPVMPGHSYLSGSLSGTGVSAFYDINVTNTAYPIGISLIMPTWSAIDFDAYLRNTAGTIIAYSNGTTRQETVTYRPTATGTYRLEVRSYSGSGPYFADISAGTTIAPPDTVSPAAPTGLAVSVPINNGGALNLAWNTNTETDLAEYNVYRGTVSGGPYTKVNSTLVTASAYTNSGLTNGITYYYVVTAVDTSGNESNKSAQASGTPVDNKAPVISGLLASPSSTGATISWKTDESADSQVEYGTTSALGTVVLNTTMVASHSVSLTGLTPSTTYFYLVKSRDAAGNLAASATQTFTTLTAPGTISGLVTNASTGAPLSGATVTDGVRSATTDISGAYTLASVPAGTYTVTASLNGYASASKGITVVAGATSVVNFALSPAPTTAAVMGKVTASGTGRAISGARVTAGGRTVFTDINGNYTIANLVPGTYTVSASASGYRTVRRTITLTAGAIATINFALPRN